VKYSDMHDEIVVLAALVQLYKPTQLKIAESMGIQVTQVSNAIEYIKNVFDIDIQWRGNQSNGYYHIVAWGGFETGKKIRRKLHLLNIDSYRTKKILVFDSAPNINESRHYRQCLKLEKLDTDKANAL